ncbi:MAG: PD-(D/E)XK nuclease domain-containing protein [Lachnospiraceae bacterium]|nr:PD-(D/E)XK nuclease domain-containing protein [Lachnospiraceae bacterium]
MGTNTIVNIGVQRFDSKNHPSDETQPERYDVMVIPHDRREKAFLFEFKVIDADDDEKTLEDILANAYRQIEEKQYEAELIAEGFSLQRIRKYGFAFRGKEFLSG